MKNILLLGLILVSVNSKADAQIFSSADSALVRVAYFNASENNNKTRLNWKVVCHLDYANFQIQRSANGADYTTIKSFTADRIRCLTPFEFEDALSSNRIFYRLKVGDKDGNFSTSKVLVAFGKSKGFDISAMVPTVVTSSAQLSISSASADKIMIYITNMQGAAILNKSLTLLKGNNTISLNLSSLPKGTFVLSTYNSEGEVKTIRFIKG